MRARVGRSWRKPEEVKICENCEKVSGQRRRPGNFLPRPYQAVPERTEIIFDSRFLIGEFFAAHEVRRETESADKLDRARSVGERVLVLIGAHYCDLVSVGVGDWNIGVMRDA